MPTTPPDAPEEAEEQPFLSHLVELRTRLLRALAAVLLIFLSLCYFATDLYHLLALPLIRPNAARFGNDRDRGGLSLLRAV